MDILRGLWWPEGVGAFSYERGAPVPIPPPSTQVTQHIGEAVVVKVGESPEDLALRVHDSLQANPQPSTLKLSQSSTLNPEPETLNPEVAQPCTLDPEP